MNKFTAVTTTFTSGTNVWAYPVQQLHKRKTQPLSTTLSVYHVPLTPTAVNTLPPVNLNIMQATTKQFIEVFQRQLFSVTYVHLEHCFAKLPGRDSRWPLIQQLKYNDVTSLKETYLTNPQRSQNTRKLVYPQPIELMLTVDFKFILNFVLK